TRSPDQISGIAVHDAAGQEASMQPGSGEQLNGMAGRSSVRIEPWGADDLPLLAKTVGDPEVMAHLGGAENGEQVARRHLRYLQTASSAGRMFKIIESATGEAVGSVGYWERTWHDEQVYEAGWMVIPAFQGRGIASAATAQAIATARVDGQHRYLHAF